MKIMNTARSSILIFTLLLAGEALAGTGPMIFCKEPEYQFGERPNTGVVEKGK